MNRKDVVGTNIKWGDQEMTVIGVYKDFVPGSPYERTQPMITHSYVVMVLSRSPFA